MTDVPGDLLQDDAQVVGLSLLLIGEERAGAAAQDALGHDQLLSVLPYVQEAAMPTQVRAALGRAEIELDDVRGRLRTRLGAPDQPLIRLRRVTWGSLLNMGLLAIAAFTLIGLLSDIDLASFLDALRDASWWWLALALVLAQIPRVPSAVSTMGSLRPTPAARSAHRAAVRHLLRQPGHPEHGGAGRHQHPVLPTVRCPPGDRRVGRA